MYESHLTRGQLMKRTTDMSSRGDTTHGPPTDVGEMQAVVQDRYGAADVLRLEHIERPEPADHEVLVRVHAAGLDRGTWHLMAGKPYLMRIAGLGLRKPKDRVPGRDLAGTVAAVGAGVPGLVVGDEVYGVGRGSFAEYAVARADKLTPKPRTLSFEQAAVVPISATTALLALTDHGRSRPANGSWLSAHPEGSAATPYRSPRHSGLRSPALPAAPSSTWSAHSARTTSSTTPATTSRVPATATT